MTDYFMDTAQLIERTAQIAAHRVCCGTEHDAANGKLHGYCVVCGVPWPCEYAGKPPIAVASESRPRDPAPLELVTDPEREDNWAGKTGILVRAKLPDGSFGSVDIAELDRASLWAWLRSRGGKNLWAENCLLALLEYKQITESEDAANR